MLAVSPLRSNLEKEGDNNREGDATPMEASFPVGGDEFQDFFGANKLLDSIDFDELFMGMHDGDDLPELEIDPELLAELRGEDQSSEANNLPVGNMSVDERQGSNNGGVEEKGHVKEGNDEGGSHLVEPINPNLYKIAEKTRSIEEKEIKSKRDKESESTTCATVNLSIKERNNGKKSSLYTETENNNNKNNPVKRKAKVDWTPELHRRFVEAVEQLGVDKAVPSRILELMGIDSLTRHNIASHLQKYRSQRKHILAREAEAANWTQKGGGNRSPWYPPTIMGFPPMSPMHHPFRPLHVWGHPTAPPTDLHGRMPIWTTQVVHPLSASPTWVPPPHPLPPLDPSFWRPPQQHVPNGMTPAAACFAQPLPSTRFTAARTPGIPLHGMYKVENYSGSPSAAAQPGFDSHMSNESIDRAIGDVLAKQWLPLPIGLKPPSVDGVLVELQRQSISKIPPACP